MIIKRLTIKLGRQPKRVAHFLVCKAGLREIQFIGENTISLDPKSILEEEDLSFNETTGELK